jgi:uncharacterized protein (TIGR02246 family)
MAFWEAKMRLLLGVVSLLLSFSMAFAGPKEDALQVIDMWAKAFTASDVDGIVKLYAPDALFMGTQSKTVVTKPEGIRKYFEAALLTDRPRGATLNSYEAMPLSDTAVVVTGLDTVTRTKDGNPTSAVGRVTFVVAKQGADWRIVHFHRSAMPQ